MAHPDEVVKVEEEVPSKLVAEAVLRHESAKDDDATDQEKKQAAVEQAHALSTRPQGSYAQLHETREARLAVSDGGHLKEMKREQADAEKADAAAVKAAQKSAVPASTTTTK